MDFSSKFSLNAGFVLEPVTDAVDDRAFADQGLYVEQLFVEWVDGWSAHAGKYNPAFGVAWDQAPGIYGADFAEDYEVTEQWGAGVVLPISAPGSVLGEMEFTADLFFADTTALSRSAIHDRGRTRRSDGGAGNVSGPRSGYSFDSGFGIDVGWRYGREGGEATRTLGAVASYVLEF